MEIWSYVYSMDSYVVPIYDKLANILAVSLGR